MRLFPILLVAGALALWPMSAAATDGDAPRDTGQRPDAGGNVVVDKGVRVEFSVAPTADRDGAPATLVDGDIARVSFRITDAETGAPISPLQPAAWITRMESSVEDLGCRERIGRYIQGMLGFQADVDLNKYFILFLNDDASISVVDPLLGVSGITQLYTMVPLAAPAEDWVTNANGTRLFVTMPKVGQVAMIDLDDFKIIAQGEAGTLPVRIAIQPDGRYLWVGDDAAGDGPSGVVVLDARTLAEVGSVTTGSGHHEIAFTDDSLFALITNEDDGTLTVVDSQRLVPVAELEIGERPVTVQFSQLSQDAYVASAGGAVAVVARESWRVVRTIETGPGLVAFRLDPTGRWGFAAHAEADRVDVIDVSRNAVVHRLDVGRLPHQLAFSDTYAYVRHLGSAEITLVPLPQLSGKGQPGLQTVNFGSRPPGEYPYPSYADAISPTGEYGAMVATNPADRMVYYYMEGMIAPMGSFSAYGRVPRAVGVVDRSLRETDAGLYQATFKVPASGEYSVALLLDSPWVDNCFSFTAEPDPVKAQATPDDPVRIEYLTEARVTAAGRPFELQFALSRAGSAKPMAGIGDVLVLTTRPPGNWQRRQVARPLGDGRYSVTVPADKEGVYYVTVAVPSLDVDFAELPYVSFRATASAAADDRG
jgi:hypothetical protein